MLKIYNTLTKQLEEFKPQNTDKVTFYQCGPTVYWVQHIGNMRAMVMADLIRRTLSYLGYKVVFVRNYTDVGHLTSDEDEGEDKMEKGAKREGVTPQEIAQKYIEVFEKDIKDLNILPADYTPKATEYIEEMIKIVQSLLDKGFAYITPKAIYFDVTKAKDYTKLSGQNLEQNREGAGAGDVSDQNKKNPQDFALWFFKTGAHKNALQVWGSPFQSSEVENGLGFPGWHIECTAMSIKLLGETLDLHMGGIEHIPVHHTNEIAQSESYTGKKFVNCWLHNEHLTVDDKKMAKSEGTSYTLNDLREKAIDPIVLRYFFLNAHYRSKQNFTWEALEAAAMGYKKLKDHVRNLHEQHGGIEISKIERHKPTTFVPDEEHTVETDSLEIFRRNLEYDFNIPSALATAWSVLSSTKLTDLTKLKLLKTFDEVLGLRLFVNIDVNLTNEEKELIKERETARKNKDWQRADEIRDQLANKYGLEVKDTATGQKINKI